MKIVSNFTDYYDYSMVYGYDPKITFERFHSTDNIISNEFYNQPYNYLVVAGNPYRFILDGNDNVLWVDLDHQVKSKLGLSYSSIMYYEKYRRNKFNVDSITKLNHPIYIVWKNQIYTNFIIGKVRENSGIGNVLLNPYLSKSGISNYIQGDMLFQTIEQFLSTKDKEIPPIPDKFLIEQKGFDKKLSFRHRK